MIFLPSVLLLPQTLSWRISASESNNNERSNRQKKSVELLDDTIEYSSNRPKRYILSSKKWTKRTLKWRLVDGQLSESDRFIIRNTLHRAFSLWQSVAALNFVEVPDTMEIPVDIEILFAKGGHGDGIPFDGPNGIIAHAFYPTKGGLHFDAAESWTLNRYDGINLYQTAVHEIGHILGLEHSTDSRAVMFPAHRPYDPDYTLGDDDIRGIRKLYPFQKQKQLKTKPHKQLLLDRLLIANRITMLR
ncbi:hypothetical protein AB6A40_007191 [Gnathostoma spinigerum]|uniref:Peptidase metallopeptidase domain-containing protein n=1 Tax=Gnathostoma spinigerum TaxID=75299 RepID=A0ABD6EV82_9BILA